MVKDTEYEHDLKVFEKYEADKKNGIVKTRPIEELFEEMEGGNNILNYQDQIKEVLQKPGDNIEFRFKENDIEYKAYYRYNEALQHIKIIISCRLDSSKEIWGDVEVYIDIENLKNENSAGFGYLEVPSMIQNKGIGKLLMRKVIDYVRALKVYYGITENIRVSGFLSQADCILENWKISVPLYEKVGNIENVKTSFYIKNSKKYVESAREFLENVGPSEGEIIYFI
ncbi:hypothetical protein SAMN04487760_10528 [Lachnospiraceae bacterium G41]|nr:hypothetical protein SAMN04487760_10528 [Lachnospiraceae bacterium G41]